MRPPPLYFVIIFWNSTFFTNPSPPGKIIGPNFWSNKVFGIYFDLPHSPSANKLITPFSALCRNLFPWWKQQFWVWCKVDRTFQNGSSQISMTQVCMLWKRLSLRRSWNWLPRLCLSVGVEMQMNKLSKVTRVAIKDKVKNCFTKLSFQESRSL